MTWDDAESGSLSSDLSGLRAWVRPSGMWVVLSDDKLICSSKSPNLLDGKRAAQTWIVDHLQRTHL